MNVTTDHISAKLLSMPKFGNGIGLHRVAWLCDELLQTNWGKQLDSIKVTGSNGKGSACVLAASIFHALGIGYGQYTSPHLIKFNERIVVDGQPITDAELTEAIDGFAAKQKAYFNLYPSDQIGAFEAFTSIALYHFARYQPEVVVAEAGIGGRYDSTRIIPGDIVGLTSVDLEHTKLLGNRLELIAYDKTDLCPDYGTLVVGHIDNHLLQRLEAYCRLRHINLVKIDDVCQFKQVRFDDKWMIVNATIGNLHFERLKIGLQGFHQLSNTAVSILLVQQWLQKNRPDLPEERFIEAVYSGLANVTWNGRFQKIASQPDIFIDVGHTPAAVQQLVRTVKEVVDKPILLVTGVSYNKEIEKIISTLLEVPEKVICTRAYHKGSSTETLLNVVKKHRPETPAFEVQTIEKAVSLAQEIARQHDMTILIAGGLFLSIEAWQAINGKDPKTCQFF